MTAHRSSSLTSTPKTVSRSAGLLENQRIGVLRVAEDVVVDRVEVMLVAGRDRSRLGKTRVVEPAAIPGPRDAGEFHPQNAVRPIDTRVDVADKDLLPIASALRQPIRRKRAGIVDRQRGQRDRPVGVHRIGIDQRAPLAVGPVLRIEHRLILQARCCA